METFSQVIMLISLAFTFNDFIYASRWFQKQLTNEESQQARKHTHTDFEH